MTFTEAQLSKHLAQTPDEALLPVYFLYGEEPFLTATYARKLMDRAEQPDFNLHRFDGQSAGMDAIEAAAETLPVMAARAFVVVKDFDAAASAAATERMVALLQTPPPDGVLVLYQSTVRADVKKGARWKALLAAAQQGGAAACLDRRTPEETARLLVSGAQRRGCTLSPAAARRMLERSGNELYLLMGELDKLCALVGEGGVVGEAEVDALGTVKLEARVFDLSKALLAGRMGQAYALLRRLADMREQPVMVLGVLCAAFVDMYRTRVAVQAGKRPEEVARHYAYKGREFALGYAARDGARLTLPRLRACLEILATADRRLKSGGDGWRVLEETVTLLMNN